MAHLASQDTAAAMVAKGDAAEELDEYRASLNGQAFDVAAFNEWAVGRRSGQSTRDVLVTWGKAADAFLAYMGLLPDEDWERKRFPWLAVAAGRYLVQSRMVEWWVHGRTCGRRTVSGPSTSTGRSS